MPSRGSIVAFVAFVGALTLAFTALVLGWLPTWAAWTLHGLIIASYVTRIPSAIRDFRRSMPKLDPDYRRP